MLVHIEQCMPLEDRKKQRTHHSPQSGVGLQFIEKETIFPLTNDMDKYIIKKKWNRKIIWKGIFDENTRYHISSWNPFPKELFIEFISNPYVVWYNGSEKELYRTYLIYKLLQKKPALVDKSMTIRYILIERCKLPYRKFKWSMNKWFGWCCFPKKLFRDTIFKKTFWISHVYQDYFNLFEIYIILKFLEKRKKLSTTATLKK